MDKLEINDMVLISTGHYGECIDKIISITKGGNYKTHHNDIFNKNGYKRGTSNSWFRSTISKATQEDFNRVKKKNIISILAKSDWNKLSLTELELIKEMIDDKK